MPDNNPPALPKLLDDCRKRLDADLGELFDELGPTLVEDARTLANATEDDSRRRAYLMLRIDLQSDWTKLTAAFRTALAQRVIAAAPGRSPTESLRAAESSLASLHILSDDETTVQIAMREVLSRIGDACADETNALERRIASMVTGNVWGPGDNPFHVKSICARLEVACAQIFTDVERRVLVLRLIGNQLADELPQLYRVINESLIDAGILPRLKRNDHVLAPPSPSAVAAESARIMGTLERLAKARAPAGNQLGSPTAAASRNEFLKSLPTFDKPPADWATGTLTNVVRLARESKAARDMRPIESVTLDIVSALFDLIFSDDKVSTGIKNLISRLQMPVLKVAMLNQQFFADRTHPARRFLDSISGIAMRWGNTVDANDPFYLKLSDLIERIQRDYDRDTSVWDTATNELGAFITERDAIEAEASRALAEAVRAREAEIQAQREAQAKAQAAADQAIEPLLTPDLPKAIDEFLRSYWRDTLQYRLSAGGADSATYADAMQIAADLIGSVAPKKNAEERQKQTAALPALLKGLNAGLDEIGILADERRAFMDSLVELQLDALRGGTRAKAAADAKDAKSRPKPATAAAGKTLQVSHATESGVRVQDISMAKGDQAAGDTKPDRASLRRVNQLVRGDWVDFITLGQTRRERLTWINPSRTLLLFSNHAADCAISITPEALAVRVANQTVRLVKRDTPMFDRAFNGAVRSVESQG